jgi:hypothetical protein
VQFIPKQVGLILPDRYRTNLRYWKSLTFSLAASNVASVRFRPSSAFDVDPTLGGTVMSGFTELSALYNSYRVLASKITVQATNTSSVQPIELMVVPFNQDVGATPAAGLILSFKEQPYSKFRLIPLSGGPVATIKSTMSTEKIYGSKMALFDDNFSALVSANPVNNWYWSIGVYVLGALAGQSIYLNVTIDVDVEFFDRAIVQN